MEYQISEREIIIHEKESRKVIYRYVMNNEKEIEKKTNKVYTETYLAPNLKNMTTNMDIIEEISKYINKEEKLEKICKKKTEIIGEIIKDLNEMNETIKVEKLYEIELTKTITLKEYDKFVKNFNTYDLSKLTSLNNNDGPYVLKYIILHKSIYNLMNVISYLFLKQNFA